MALERGDVVFRDRPEGAYMRRKGEVLARIGNLETGRPRYRIAWEDGTNGMVEREELIQEAPDGQPFVWGEIMATHVVGPYAIVEFLRNKPGNAKPDWEQEISFHYYVRVEFSEGFEDTNHSASSLDRALVESVAFRNEWINRGSSAALNSRAGSYFMRSIGPDCHGAEA